MDPLSASDHLMQISTTLNMNPSPTIDFLSSNYQNIKKVQQIQNNVTKLIEQESSKTNHFIIKKCYIITTAIATSLVLTKIVAFGLLWAKSTSHFTSSYPFYASIVVTGFLSIVFHILNENSRTANVKTIRDSTLLTVLGNETTRLKDWCTQVSKIKSELNRLLRNCKNKIENSSDETTKAQFISTSEKLELIIKEVNTTTDYIKRSNTLKLYVLSDIELSNF